MTETRTQATLLERLREGVDATAWQGFFDKYWRAMYAFARARGCSGQTAEDVVQDAMLAVFEEQPAFHYDPSRGRFRNWLFTIVRQKLALARRRLVRQPQVAPDGGPLQPALDGPAAECEADPAAVWEGVFEGSLLVALLDVVREEVSPATYQAFELTALHDVPVAEATSLTGLSRNAVYQARKRVLARLRELGTAYRDEGQLHASVKDALAQRPPASAERSVSKRIETTMASRREARP